ncbi:MAG: histidine kinase N-terminal 7TM domain-containing protein [Chloroflexota bacterium]
MSFQSSPYILPLLFSALINLGLMVYAWRNRPAPGATALVFLFLGMGAWSLADGLRWASAGYEAQLFWASARVPATELMTVALLAFAIRYVHGSGWLTTRRIFALFLIPFAIQVGLWTNGDHQLFWQAVQPVTVGSSLALDFAYGPLFWVHALYDYLLIAAAMLMLARAFLRSLTLYRAQIAAVLIATVVPLSANFLSITKTSPFPYLDLTPFGFTLSGVALALAIFRFRILDVVPAARDAVIQNMDEGVVVLDDQDRVVDVNLAAERTFGKVAPSLIGSPVQDVLPQWETLLEAGDGGTQQMDIDFPAEDGTVRSFEVRLSPIVDERNLQSARVMLLHDVTERRRTEESLRHTESKFEEVLKSIEDAYYETDLSGKLLLVNEAFGSALGYTKEELRGKHFRRLTRPSEARKMLRDFHRVYSEGKPIKRVEYCFETASGEDLYAELSVSLIRDPDGEPVGFRGLTRDVTDRRRAQEELRLAKETAEAAKAAAEAANEAKSTFLANMSHELRTPLNAIIGYSEMLMEDADDLELDDFHTDLQKIHGAGKHLLALISDVLDLSKIEAGKMELYLETVDVPMMVQDVVNTIQPLAEKNGNRLLVNVGAEVDVMVADMTKVRQALFNLLSNACKFTEQGEVRLSVEKREKEGIHWMTFTVVDSGIGMTAEQVDRLFEPFTQADASTTRKYGGTGLGLTITQRFCQMMGGEVTVESEPDVGSTFTIWLPEAVGEDAVEADGLGTEPAEIGSHSNEESGALALVVDDDEAARDLIGRILHKEGFQVHTVAGGEEALNAARRLRPFVIILDVLMPGMDGWAVLKELKADEELAKIPVIMTSMISDKNLGFALGAADYLVKPIDRERLCRLLRKYEADREQGPLLVVEDNPDTQEMLARMLAREGWDVRVAQNGRVALEEAAKARPALVLLDLMMPEMDGFEFMARFRKMDGMAGVPTIVITAKEITAEERRRLNGQVRSILQKGAYSRDQLLEEVRQMVSALRQAAPHLPEDR